MNRTDNFANIEYSGMPPSRVAGCRILWTAMEVLNSADGPMPMQQVKEAIEGRMTFTPYELETYESSNLYQLHAYVSQLRRQALHPEGNRNSRPHPHDHCAEGVLLYATVDEKDFVHRFDMPPHQMTVATVNLARGWRSVESRLLEVIELSKA